MAGFGLLVAITLTSLHFAIWRIAVIAGHLIDIVTSSRPLLIAERLSESSDQRWSVTVLVATLPLFLGGYAVLASRLEEGRPSARSRILMGGMALLFLDLAAGLFSFDFSSIVDLAAQRSLDAGVLKIVATTLIVGAVLGYAGWEVARASRS